ncbi:hypothetical protein [Romboutsia sp. 1001285H_161024_C4]|nr:hypothetical protein [Romboutsia sp. 1001285H_161024_C4]
MNKTTIIYDRDFNKFVSLLNKHNIDLGSEKAKMLFESYKKVIN